MNKRSSLPPAALLLAVLLSLVTTACGPREAAGAIDTLAHAKGDLYTSAQELAADATVILRGVKTEREENVANNLGGPDHYWGYTISQVQVQEIMKNTSGLALAVGDEIPVLENQFTYRNTHNIAVTCHVDRYQKMQPGSQYFLYLRYSASDGWYVILSGLFGKVPVSAEEPVLFPADKLTLAKGQTAEDGADVQQILETIRQESLELYP